MISIQLVNTTLIIGSRTIFKEVNWEIQNDQKIGLIGPNGAGKSSLFKLIMSEFQLEPGGNIVKAKGVTLGYLPQHPEFNPEKTAIDLVIDAIPRLVEIENELLNVEARMAEPEIYQNGKSLDRAIQLQQKLLVEYETLGGESFPVKCRELLNKLGLSESDAAKPVGLLSGGQKKLIGLARLLMQKPSVLLLDEPDNHLDIPAKGFLERLIVNYPGAVVLISHDRYLLDASVNQIAEIEDGRLTTFSGNYTDFILEKEKRLAKQEELFQIQQRAISRMELALKRYQIWVQVSDKFASRVQSMKTRLEKVNEIDRPILDRRQIGLELTGWRGSNQVLELVSISKSFQNRHLLNNANFLIRHGERVGLIGANGAGKSILLRMILGNVVPDHGEIKLGPSVKIGYYAQEHETLDFDLTLIETVRRAANMTEANAVAFLIGYLFTYQQANQKISSLSGGERSRLQLALLVLSGANFLLLDEPTNNLDIASAEVLENALSDFIGTVLVISHDRYFLDSTVSRILSLENGRIKEYIGGYSDYYEKKYKS